MRKIRELLRLKHSGRSQRQIASSLSVAVGTVCGQLKRAQEVGMTWERAERLTDAELEALMFATGGGTSPRREPPSTTLACMGSCTGLV